VGASRLWWKRFLEKVSFEPGMVSCSVGVVNNYENSDEDLLRKFLYPNDVPTCEFSILSSADRTFSIQFMVHRVKQYFEKSLVQLIPRKFSCNKKKRIKNKTGFRSVGNRRPY